MSKHTSTTIPATAKMIFKMGLALATMLLCSCSNDLSRQKAADLISKQQKLPSIETIQLGKSYLKESRHDSWGVCMVIGDKYSDVKERLDELQAKGLISVGEQSAHEGQCNYLWAIVELTDEGKKYLVTDAGGEYQLKASQLTFGEITGIQTHEQLKVAEADYTLRKSNISPFGSNTGTVLMNRKATFALFDDGWRIR